MYLLKPYNLCYKFPLLDLNFPLNIFQLKIADFGFARFLNDEDMAATLCGSPIYMVSCLRK